MWGGGSSKLTVDMNQAQILYQKHRIYLIALKIWIALTILLEIWCNIKNVILSISKGRIIFNVLPFMIMMILLILGIFVIALWNLLHSRYSPIQKWKLETLLRNFTEEANLLAQHNDSFNFTKSVKWSYPIKRYIK